MPEQVEWEEVDDGEYNETSAIVNGCEISVYSDRDGINWDYRIDEGDFIGGYDSEEEAKEAAVADAMSRE